MSMKEKLKIWILFPAIPLLTFLAVFLIPFISGVGLSFTDWTGTNIGGFIGLQNYIDAFTDQNFIDSMLLTFKYVFFSIVLVNIVGFGLALLVTSNIKGKNLLRSIFFIPNMIGGVILGFVWQTIFNTAFVYFGEISGLSIFEHSWLTDPTKAFWAMLVVTVWQQAGYMMLIYIAGIISIPDDVMESAMMDGAGPVRKLFSIKIPLMVQSFTICLFLTLRNAFMMFDVNLSLTNGGPFGSTQLITMNIYNSAFLNNEFGVSQAKAVIFFIVVAVIAITQVTITKRMEND